MNAGWRWLTENTYSWRFVARVLVKAAVLFVLFNLVYALLGLTPVIGQLSLYNSLVRGRDRLPYGEDPASFNLSLFDLNAMFSSHTLDGRRSPDEATVLVIGDSSVWGILLDNPDTLTACLNERDIQVNGLPARFYNLGYPTLSVLKDLLLLDTAMAYEPDLIIWPVTLESMKRAEQLDAPLVAHNPDRVRALIDTYDLDFAPDDPRLIDQTPLDRTIIGQRRPLADWWRLQWYGVTWGTTGIDQVYPAYNPRANDFDDDVSWKGLSELAEMTDDTIAFDVLDAGVARAGDVPLLLINEPIFMADGVNSDLRYNFWYPRWAFDNFRTELGARAEQAGWWYADLWDAVPPSEFTDSPVHLTPDGSWMLCDRVAALLEPA